jgi:hypothetical protein
LLEHQFLVRREIPTISRGGVYSLTRAGESELIGPGEFFAGATGKVEPPSGHLQHALELNEIHLALKQSGRLVRWAPGSDIRFINEFTDTATSRTTTLWSMSRWVAANAASLSNTSAPRKRRSGTQRFTGRLNGKAS